MTVPNHKTQFNTIQTLITLFYCFIGKKIIDFIMRPDASRGRKSKVGGKKSKATQLYTPLERFLPDITFI